MSNLEAAPAEAVGGGRAAVAGEPVHQPLAGREVVIGTRGMRVTRTLPHRDRRMVGAWCFVDHYGPEDITGGPGMRVGPHPHTGLQTVSWLVEGDVLHRDSLGNEQLIRPGQLNLMTAGAAIAHAEESPAGRPPRLHGVQLWVALPDRSRWVDPHFEHHPGLPVLAEPGVEITVLMGELAGVVSPARTYSPLVGAELVVKQAAGVRLPLRPDFEYAVLPLSGEPAADGSALTQGTLLYLGRGRTELAVQAPGPARVLLLGGEPFDERIVMWWNFVGRSHEEIVRFRADWAAERGYPPVLGYSGDRLPAPPLPGTPLLPRGRER
jgi:redox-sensitive bicupin YhaK (pirin superfamily)